MTIKKQGVSMNQSLNQFLKRVFGHVTSSGQTNSLAAAVFGAAEVVSEFSVAVAAVMLHVPNAFAEAMRSAAQHAETDLPEHPGALQQPEAAVRAGTANVVNLG